MVESVAIVLAACSAGGFALSTSLQHHSAEKTPAAVRGTGGLLLHLAGRPWWMVGQLVAVVSFVLHAVALRLGTIVAVQPVVVSGIVLAVPVRAALIRRLPSLGEVVTVGITAAGLAVLLIASQPSAGTSLPNEPVSALGTLAVVGAAGLLALFAARRPDPHRSATWFGVAAGLLFGLVAGLVKLTFSQLDAASGAGGVLGSWALWAVLVTGLCGVAINQRAYRIARLSASMPVLNIVDVLVALGFGVAVFHEMPRHTAGAAFAQALALGCIGLGLRRLSRSKALKESAPSAREQKTGPGDARGTAN